MALDGIAESLADDLKSKKELTLDNHPGMHYVLQFEDDGVEMVVVQRVFLVKNRMYQVIVGVPAANTAQANTDRFLDSFKLTAASTATAEPPVPTTGTAPPDDWHTCTAEDKSFQISFPGELDEPLGDDGYYADYDKGFYCQLERGNSTIDPQDDERCQDYFDVVVMNNSEDSGEKLANDRKLRFQGHPARWFTVEHDDNGTMVEHHLVFVTPGRQFHLTTETRADAQPDQLARSFFNSFKLAGPTKSPSTPPICESTIAA